MPALPARRNVSADELQRRACRERDGRVRVRLIEIANALDGMSRRRAAHQGGMDRQTLRNLVIRFSAQGIEGLCDRLSRGRRPWLSEGQQAALKVEIQAGPDPERDGISSFRIVDICRIAEESYGVRYSERDILRLVRALDLSWQKARPLHPRARCPCLPRPPPRPRPRSPLSIWCRPAPNR